MVASEVASKLQRGQLVLHTVFDFRVSHEAKAVRLLKNLKVESIQFLQSTQK